MHIQFEGKRKLFQHNPTLKKRDYRIFKYAWFAFYAYNIFIIDRYGGHSILIVLYKWK